MSSTVSVYMQSVKPVPMTTGNMYVLHRLTTIKLLIAHLHEAHGMLIENKNLTFSSFEKFQEWKCKEETSTHSSYVQHCAPYTVCVW